MKGFVFLLAVIAFIPDGCASYEDPSHTEAQCLSWDCEYGCGCELFEDSFERTTGWGGTWHDRYIEDNCRRCPECCVSDLWDGGDDRENENTFCTPEACPGEFCPCVLDDKGVWWVNATLSFDDSETP